MTVNCLVEYSAVALQLNENLITQFLNAKNISVFSLNQQG